MLVALALFAVPALAAPPLHKVTYGGWGVTGNQPFATDDVIGSTVHFAGQAQQAADGTWTGQGTFMDKDYVGGTVKGHLVVDAGTFISPSLIQLRGIAAFSVDNVKIGEWDFVLWLEQDGDYQTYELDVIGGPRWWVSGINAINGGPVRIT